MEYRNIQICYSSDSYLNKIDSVLVDACEIDINRENRLIHLVVKEGVLENLTKELECIDPTISIKID